MKRQVFRLLVFCSFYDPLTLYGEKAKGPDILLCVLDSELQQNIAGEKFKLTPIKALKDEKQNFKLVVSNLNSKAPLTKGEGLYSLMGEKKTSVLKRDEASVWLLYPFDGNGLAVVQILFAEPDGLNTDGSKRYKKKEHPNIFFYRMWDRVFDSGQSDYVFHGQCK